jgi:hypothetical protein
MTSTLARFESSGHSQVGNLRITCVFSSCWQRKGIALWMPQTICNNPDICERVQRCDETCRDACWISCRTFWAFTLSAIAQQIKCFRTYVYVHNFSPFCMWNSCPKLFLSFQLHIVQRRIICRCWIICSKDTGQSSCCLIKVYSDIWGKQSKSRMP